MRRDCTEPTARYLAPVPSLQEWSPLIGSTPEKKAGVMTAAVPLVEPEIVIVGADVYPEPEFVIVTVAIAPPETV